MLNLGLKTPLGFLWCQLIITLVSSALIHVFLFEARDFFVFFSFELYYLKKKKKIVIFS